MTLDHYQSAMLTALEYIRHEAPDSAVVVVLMHPPLESDAMPALCCEANVGLNISSTMIRELLRRWDTAC